jgi:hypothetical protein
MQFDKLFYIFYDDENCLGDILSEIAESQDEHEFQKILDDHIDTLQNNDKELMHRIDGAIGTLRSTHLEVGFVAGFLYGQAFDITDPGALKELHFLKAKLEAEGVIRYWPRDKKAPELPGKEDPGAPSEQLPS